MAHDATGDLPEVRIYVGLAFRDVAEGDLRQHRPAAVVSACAMSDIALSLAFTPTEFYRPGLPVTEPGVVVTVLPDRRYAADAAEQIGKAIDLARVLRDELGQRQVLVVVPATGEHVVVGEAEA